MKKIIIHLNENRMSRIGLLDYDYYIQNIFIKKNVEKYSIISNHAKSTLSSHVLHKLYLKNL